MLLSARIFYWGLGIGDWGLGPIPNPQSPIPNSNYFDKVFTLKQNFNLTINFINIIKITSFIYK
jgi:hypothetical protein